MMDDNTETIKSNYFPNNIWTKLDEGLWIANLKIPLRLKITSSKITLVKIRPENFDLMIGFTDKTVTTIKEMTSSNKGVLGVNASFFDHSKAPLGLIIKDKNKVQDLVNEGNLLSGVLFFKEGKWQILHRRDFVEEDVEQALQAGPRLIYNKKPINITTKPVAAKRTGVALDNDGALIFYATKGRILRPSFQQMQRFLLRPDLNILHALNLDGGGSTQLFLDTDKQKQPVHIVGEDPIPVGLIVRRRSC